MKKLLKRILIFSTLAIGLLIPMLAGATGQLVKGKSYSGIYYVGEDGKRYVFPNEGTYGSWYGDFSGITEVSDVELGSIPIGGNVTYRPGTRLVKITTDPKTYAVDRGGILRWVMNETVATELYGSMWNTLVSDVPDEFFVNYRVGLPIASANDFSPAIVAESSTSISIDKSLNIPTGQPLLTIPIMEPAPVEPTPVEEPKKQESVRLKDEVSGYTTKFILTNPNDFPVRFQHPVIVVKKEKGDFGGGRGGLEINGAGYAKRDITELANISSASENLINLPNAMGVIEPNGIASFEITFLGPDVEDEKADHPQGTVELQKIFLVFPDGTNPDPVRE